MHATDRAAPGPVAAAAGRGASRALPDAELELVLLPLSRPELGEIRIADSLFPVGRTEAPFASYGDDVLTMLSRRHARIFRERGVVYLADLGSRNGTTVNRAEIGQAPCPLHDGDEIGFGGVLSYRVQIAARAQSARREGGPVLTLTPAPGGSGLETIVVERFPYLVGKADAAFARQRSGNDPQLRYLSRRHAHLFLRGGGVCIEDLASTNGTYVDGLRLQEQAVPLQDGQLVAFGGEHFTYRVGIAQGAASEAVPAARGTAPRADASPDKTTFVVAPTSFLDIFCADDGSADERAPEPTTLPAPAESRPARRRPRSRALLLLSELATLAAGTGAEGGRRGWWKGAALALILVAAAAALTQWGAAERELRDAVARGAWPQAATLADRQLALRPDDTDLRALATESALKAHLPGWLAALRSGDFAAAGAALAGLSALGERNPDLPPLVAELEWLGRLEQLVGERGGPDAPIRIYADEDRIDALLARWNENTGEHQRTLARVASLVPQFREPYAEALTHLRRLQSEASVYLVAIASLKSGIDAALHRDSPEELEPLLAEAAGRYPRLGGLDGVRADLARFVDLRREARAPGAGRVFALQRQARFATPPFQQAYRALAASGQLPSAELARLYDAATRDWQAGDADRSLAGLQAMAAGRWAPAVSAEIRRRQDVAARFAALQSARAAGDFAEQLLAFRVALDPAEDGHFVRATDADLARHQDRLAARAQESMQRARAAWQEYRSLGAIEAAQRIETEVSAAFRSRALALAEASRQARQGMQIHAQLDAAAARPWAPLLEEIEAELRQQRNALLALRNVLRPELMKTKLALLGGPNE